MFHAPLRLRVREGKFREPDLLLLRDANDPRGTRRLLGGCRSRGGDREPRRPAPGHAGQARGLCGSRGRRILDRQPHRRDGDRVGTGWRELTPSTASLGGANGRTRSVCRVSRWRSSQCSTRSDDGRAWRIADRCAERSRPGGLRLPAGTVDRGAVPETHEHVQSLARVHGWTNRDIAHANGSAPDDLAVSPHRLPAGHAGDGGRGSLFAIAASCPSRQVPGTGPVARARRRRPSPRRRLLDRRRLGDGGREPGQSTPRHARQAGRLCPRRHPGVLDRQPPRRNRDGVWRSMARPTRSMASSGAASGPIPRTSPVSPWTLRKSFDAE